MPTDSEDVVKETITMIGRGSIQDGSRASTARRRRKGAKLPKCICPVVEIKVTKEAHVSEVQMKTVADALNAAVSMEVAGRMGRSLYGKHRADCPCGPKKGRR